MKRIFIAVVALTLLGAGCSQAPRVIEGDELTFKETTPAPQSSMETKYSSPTVLPDNERTGKQATIKTPKGTIVFELFGDEAPLTVSNFITLAKGGYFNGITFHRVVPGFVIQGGDPTGSGSGGPGYQFKDEPLKRGYSTGTVAMANSGPDTNGSQFFIVLPGGGPNLGPLYTIFGQVTSGIEVVSKIAVGDVMTTVTIEEKK